jgi:enoyl-CoA hydratase/carnithine racemase
MTALGPYETIGVEIDDFVATLEIQRPPNNFFSVEMIKEIAAALETMDDMPEVRSVLFCSQGKHFCAGNDFSSTGGGSDQTGGPQGTNPLYSEGVRLFRTKKPIVAAVQGAAIGGGLGLAMAADFRVAAPEARFSANFSLLGFHHGFGLTMTLPRIIGEQQANLMLYTGRRLKGEEALEIGLCEYLVPLAEVRTRAWDLAREIATAAPLAVQSIRATMRAGMAEAYAKATDHEAMEQGRLRQTEDFREGIKASAERRTPNFAER